MAKHRKELCDKCNLDGECCCQETQKQVNSCGMEQVLGYNKLYNEALKNGEVEFEDDFKDY